MRPDRDLTCEPSGFPLRFCWAPREAKKKQPLKDLVLLDAKDKGFINMLTHMLTAQLIVSRDPAQDVEMDLKVRFCVLLFICFGSVYLLALGADL